MTRNAALRFALASLLLSAGAASFVACSRESSEHVGELSPVAPSVAMPPATPACSAGSHRGEGTACIPDDEPSASASASAAAAPPSGKCPDVTNPERMPSFDWAKEAQVDAMTASKLHGISGTASETKSLAAEIEIELKSTCARMAAELGSKGPWPSAEATCQAAIDALRAARAKLGPGAKVALNVHSAFCPASVEIMTECAKKCDGNDASITCSGGATVGKCAGTCDGPCEARPAGKCGGTCQGRCDSNFTGTCTGECKGTCDGKDMKAGGTCAGKCEGSCDGTAKGDCKGRCLGGCLLKSGACDGVCYGKCSVPVTDAKCTSMPKAAATLGGECAAYCLTRAVRRVACGLALVSVDVTSAKDEAAARQYESAVSRNLPHLLKVDQQLKGRVDAISKGKTVIADGLKAVTQGAGPGLAPFVPCLFGYEKSVDEAVLNLRANAQAVALVASVALIK